MKTKFLLLSLLVMFVLPLEAALVDTIKVHSDAMNKDIQAVVVLPGKGKTTAPVIYLLHGFG